MSSWKPNAVHDHVFAIVRVDTYSTAVPPHTAITVTKIVWTQVDAEAEVSRLNQLNADKKCIYFWQITRLVRRT